MMPFARSTSLILGEWFCEWVGHVVAWSRGQCTVRLWRLRHSGPSKNGRLSDLLFVRSIHVGIIRVTCSLPL